MKYTRVFILLAGLFIFACSPQPNPQMAQLQRYYALKGEGIHPAVKRPDRSGPRQGAMPYLSTTNVTPPLAPMPTPLAMTNAPPSFTTTNAPTPLSTTNTPVPNN